MTYRRIPTLTIVFVIALSLGVGLMVWRRIQRIQKPATPSAAEVSEEMRARARQAIQAAIRDFNVQLDGTPESVEKVEEILAKVHERYQQGSLSHSDLIKESLKWGAYVGEAIKRVHPGRWALDSAAGGPGSLPVVYEDKSESYPTAWCYRRITNGEEDNVWHKFVLLVLNRDQPGGVTFKPEDNGSAPGDR
jgi:hypothetical protein